MKKFICILLLGLFGCTLSHERIEREYHLNKITSVEIGTSGNCRFIYWTIRDNDSPIWTELIDSCGKHKIGDTIIIK